MNLFELSKNVLGNRRKVVKREKQQVSIWRESIKHVYDFQF